MIDVFIRTTSNEAKNRLRRAFFEATCARWDMEDVAIRLLVNKGIREGRVFAEQEAHSDPYIVTDSDVVVVGRNWVARGLDAMRSCPEYAVCSSLSLIEGENLAVPPPDAGKIYPMHSVGAPMWIRRGILTDLPEMDLNGECGVIHDYVLKKGYKEGLITGLRHLHCGHGFSSTPGLDFGF
jgi:hypothetical protein